METLQPILKRGRDVWDPINMPKSEFQQRVGRIREAMKKEGVDVLLLYGCNVDEYGHPCYVSNFATKLSAASMVIVPGQSDLTLLFEGSSRELKIGKRVTWIDDTRPCLGGVFGSTGSLAGDCARYLQENKFIPSKIGFVGLRELMPYPELQFLTGAITGCEVVDATPIIRNMRMTKSTRESDQIRRASRVVSNTFAMIPEMVFGDRNEKEVEARIDWAMRIQGAEDVRILLGRPQQSNWSMRPAEDRPVSQGETVLVYLAGAFERYWAAGARTFRAEKSSLAEVRDEKVSQLWGDSVAALKPGKSGAQFYRETMDGVKAKGMGCIPHYGLGHGIGLSPQEPPAIDDQDPHRFAEGMCFVLHLAIRDQEKGAVMLGNTVYLSEHGPELLTV